MTDSQDVPLRVWLGERFDAMEKRFDERITELKSDHKDRLDYHERLFVGNGQEGMIQRLVRTTARVGALEDSIGPHLASRHTTEDKKKERLSLAGLTGVIAAVVAGIVAGLSGRPQ